MKYKQLGDTSVRVSEIGFGTWEYHGGIKPLRKAIALGATFIDTAESYGTEEVVGAAIRGVRQEVILATKVSPKNFHRAGLIAAVERSLKRLQTDYIDLYQLHWRNYRVPLEETLSTMEELVDAGKVRCVGVSKFAIADLKDAKRAVDRCRIVANQVRYSVVERTGDPELLEYCESEKITILAFSPLGQNFFRLRSNDPKDVLGQIAEQSGKTRAQVALNWCITKRNTVAIVKADSMHHVVEDCAASGWSLRPEQIKPLDEEIKFRKKNSLAIMSGRLAQRFIQMTGRHLELPTSIGLSGTGSLSEANSGDRMPEGSYGE
jgi:diketogulonate reductase-like aldo/keto reductase